MSELMYISTRDKSIQKTASQAILQGLSPDGGLFVPQALPRMDKSISELSKLSYQDLAYEVMKLFLTDFTEDELRGCISAAYGSGFDSSKIAPLHKAGSAYYLELFHGKTIAFKDMALSILPHLMTTSAKKNGLTDEIVILTATSGDTGKAALSGFAGVPGTRIIVFYPKDGVSDIQKLQMVTQEGDNTLVVGIDGNFDQAQTGVKMMFSDDSLKSDLKKSGFVFSSANSINIGRLVPQIVYYFWSYCQLLSGGKISDGDSINVTVPTGNFGNILAAFYAKQMGLPIAKLICASNENKVLYDFFTTGDYDKNREFTLTSSPSMDILISSNLERLIYFIAGEDDAANRGLMESLSTKGIYSITPSMKEKLVDFYGNFATEAETKEEIRRVFEDSGYIIDPHTAVASSVYEKYKKETGDETITVIASTASPYKFTRTVMQAIGRDDASKSDIELTDDLKIASGVSVPAAIEEIKSAPVRHTTLCSVDGMEQVVRDFLA